MKWIIMLAVFCMKIYFRFIEYSDYMLCYDCKEMDSPETPYDFIIVGMGSAGSVIARRLAQNKDLKILVLEAGAHGDFVTKVPIMSLMMQRSNFDWGFTTEPQKNACAAMKENRSTWPRGKIVGGTHSLNNMIYFRGHHDDFHEWYKHDSNYRYEDDVLPYFKKSENFIEKSNNEKEGSFILSEAPFLSSFNKYFLDAAESLGLSINPETHDSKINGFSRPKTTTFNGQRWTTATHTLNQNMPNIILRTQTLAEKVIFKNNYEAYAIKYLYLNKYYYTTAKKGIILSAGVVGSPKILMLSGIGPRDHLKSLGIKPKIILPVGDNLQDHVTTGLDLVLLNQSIDLTVHHMAYPSSVYNYFTSGSGPWTSIGCDAIGFLNFEKNKRPELQLMAMQAGISTDKGAYTHSLIGIKPEIWTNYFEKIDKTAVSILPVVLHPKSRGTVRLRDKNVHSKPLINPNYLSNKYDVEILLKGIEFIKKLVNTDAMKKIGAEINANGFPGCEHLNFDSADYWECYVRHMTLTTYHPVGTCQMGGVVDYEFRVKNTNKLYVVDASVMPELVSGNIIAAVVMLAEKAADVIKYHQYLNSYVCNIRDIFMPVTICR